jgi:site-specific recombinase
MGHDWRAAHSGHRHSAFRSCNMAKTLEMAGVFSICLFWLGLFLW